LNGLPGNYDAAYDQLLFSFYASGSYAFSRPTSIYNPLNYPPAPPPALPVTVDTDLTLYPVTADFRPELSDTVGPTLTSALFTVWNENEDSRTGMSRCITCWDQEVISKYDPTNNFDVVAIGTDMGKAQIDGIKDNACEPNGSCCCQQFCLGSPAVLCGVNNGGLAPCAAFVPATCGFPPGTCFDIPDCDADNFNFGVPDRDCSESAALLGVSDKILTFGGATIGTTDAGMTLVGHGTQTATVTANITRPSGTLVSEAELRTGQDLSHINIEDAELTPVVEPVRSQRRGLPDKE
jgi:hypothetical protein